MAAPALAAAIGGVIINITASVVGRVLVSLGLGLVTYTGIDVTLGWLKGEASGWVAQLPSSIVSMLALMKVGPSLNIIFSAVLMRMAINGFQSGSFKRWVNK